MLGGGNSSGNYITTFLNTLINHAMFILVFRWLAKKNDCVVTDEELILFLYSDDNMSATKYPWWNNITVAEAFKELFGLTFTSPSKGEVLVPFYSLDEVEFLSRRFRKDGNLYRSPLNMDSLVTQLYYVRAGTQRYNQQFILGQLRINLDNVKRELWQYPQERAEAIWDEIREFCQFHEILVPELQYIKGQHQLALDYSC